MYLNEKNIHCLNTVYNIIYIIYKDSENLEKPLCARKKAKEDIQH